MPRDKPPEAFRALGFQEPSDLPETPELSPPADSPFPDTPQTRSPPRGQQDVFTISPPISVLASSYQGNLHSVSPSSLSTIGQILPQPMDGPTQNSIRRGSRQSMVPDKQLERSGDIPSSDDIDYRGVELSPVDQKSPPTSKGVLLTITVMLLKVANIVALFVLLGMKDQHHFADRSLILPATVTIVSTFGVLLLVELVCETLHASRVGSNFLVENHEINKEVLTTFWGVITLRKRIAQFFAACNAYRRKRMLRYSFTIIEFLFAISGVLIMSFLWRTKVNGCLNDPDEVPANLSESIYDWTWTDRYVPQWLEQLDVALLTINTFHPLNGIVDTRADKSILVEALGSPVFWVSRFNQPIVLLPLSYLLAATLCMQAPYMVMAPARIIVATCLLSMGYWTRMLSRGNRNTELIIFNVVRVTCVFLTFASLLMLMEFNPIFAKTNESVMGESFIASGIRTSHMHGGVGYYLYFSIIVATTVGLGDIHPVTIRGQAITGIFVVVVFANVPRFIDSYQQARKEARLNGYLPYSFQRKNTIYIVGPIRKDIGLMICNYVSNVNGLTERTSSANSPVVALVFIVPETDYHELVSLLRHGHLKKYMFNVSVVKGDFKLGGDNIKLAEFMGKVEDCRAIFLVDKLRSSLIPVVLRSEDDDHTPMRDTIFRMKAIQYFFKVPVPKIRTMVMSFEEVGLIRLLSEGRVHHLSEIRAAILASTLMGNRGLASLILPLFDLSIAGKTGALHGKELEGSNDEVSLRYIQVPKPLLGIPLKEAIELLYDSTQLMMIAVLDKGTKVHAFLHMPHARRLELGSHHRCAVIGRNNEYAKLQDKRIEFRSKKALSAKPPRVGFVEAEVAVSVETLEQQAVHDKLEILRTMTLRGSYDGLGGDDTPQSATSTVVGGLAYTPGEATTTPVATTIPSQLNYTRTAYPTSSLYANSHAQACESWIHPDRPFILIFGLSIVSVTFLDYLVEGKHNILILTCGAEVPHHPRTLERYSGHLSIIPDKFRAGPNFVSLLGLDKATSILVADKQDSHSLFYYNILSIYSTSGSAQSIADNKNKMVLVLKEKQSLDYFHDRKRHADYYHSDEFLSGRAFVDNALHPVGLHDFHISPQLGVSSDAIIRHLVGLDPSSGVDPQFDFLRIQRRLNDDRIFLRRVDELLPSDFAPMTDQTEVQASCSVAYDSLVQEGLRREQLVLGVLVVSCCEETTSLSRRVMAKPDGAYQVRNTDYVYVLGNSRSSLQKGSKLRPYLRH